MEVYREVRAKSFTAAFLVLGLVAAFTGTATAEPTVKDGVESGSLDSSWIFDSGTEDKLEARSSNSINGDYSLWFNGTSNYDLYNMWSNVNKTITEPTTFTFRAKGGAEIAYLVGDFHNSDFGRDSTNNSVMIRTGSNTDATDVHYSLNSSSNANYWSNVITKNNIYMYGLTIYPSSNSARAFIRDSSGNLLRSENKTGVYLPDKVKYVNMQFRDRSNDLYIDDISRDVSLNSAPKIIDTDYEPENPQQSDTVYLKANVTDPDQNLDTVTATVTESGNTILDQEMTPANGLYETSFNVTEENATYEVTYTATDTKGATDTTQETIAVPLNNDDPELGNLSRTPENPKIYDSLSFSADATDSDTNLAGLNFTLTRDGETVVHRELSGSGIYDLNDIATAEPGSYTAKYVAYDAKGSTDTKTQSFNVADPTTGVSITLRDAPDTQSFSSIQGSDSTNITVENDTVKENGSDATYVTQQINSGQFDLAAIHMSGTGTVEAVNLAGNETAAITQDLVTGANTVDLSELDTQKIQLRVKLDQGAEITGLQVYGEDYGGGWFGGIVGPTGGFMSNVPVIGEFLNGISTGLDNFVTGILNVPADMLEGILEVLPAL